MTAHNATTVASVVVTYADGRTSLHRDATDALAAEMNISRHKLGNLLMGALGGADELAAGIASRYSLPLEPVEAALGILEALAERKADTVRYVKLAAWLQASAETLAKEEVIQAT